jgi:hypothetical protein
LEETIEEAQLLSLKCNDAVQDVEICLWMDLNTHP